MQGGNGGEAGGGDLQTDVGLREGALMDLPLGDPIAALECLAVGGNAEQQNPVFGNGLYDQHPVQFAELHDGTRPVQETWTQKSKATNPLTDGRLDIRSSEAGWGNLLNLMSSTPPDPRSTFHPVTNIAVQSNPARNQIRQGPVLQNMNPHIPHQVQQGGYDLNEKYRQEEEADLSDSDLAMQQLFYSQFLFPYECARCRTSDAGREDANSSLQHLQKRFSNPKVRPLDKGYAPRKTISTNFLDTIPLECKPPHNAYYDNYYKDGRYARVPESELAGVPPQKSKFPPFQNQCIPHMVEPARPYMQVRPVQRPAAWRTTKMDTDGTGGGALYDHMVPENQGFVGLRRSSVNIPRDVFPRRHETFRKNSTPYAMPEYYKPLAPHVWSEMGLNSGVYRTPNIVPDVEQQRHLAQYQDPTGPANNGSDADTDLENIDFDDVTVVVLKEHLRRRGLPSFGKKSQLVERLKADLEASKNRKVSSSEHRVCGTQEIPQAPGCEQLPVNRKNQTQAKGCNYPHPG